MRCPWSLASLFPPVNDDHPARYPIYAYRTKPHDIRRFLVDLPLWGHKSPLTLHYALSTGLLPRQFCNDGRDPEKMIDTGFDIIGASSLNLTVCVPNSFAREMIVARMKRIFSASREEVHFWNNYPLRLLNKLWNIVCFWII